MSGSQNDFHLDENDWYYHTPQYDDTRNFDSEFTRPYAVHDVGDSSAQEAMPTGIHQPAPFGLMNFQPRDQLNVDALLYDYSEPYGTSGLSSGQIPSESHTSESLVRDTWTSLDNEDGTKLETTTAPPNTSESSMTTLPVRSKGSKGSTKIRRRKAFDLPDREKVALTRNVGACLRCRTKRVSCEFKIPCDKCIKIFGSASSAHGLCSRQELRATRFNNIDLLREKFFGAVIDEFKSTSTGRRYVGFSYPTCCGPSFVAPMMGAENPSFETNVFTYFDPESVVCTFRHRLITPLPHRESYEPRPSLEVFFQRCSLSSHEGLTGPFSRLHKTFGEFAELCCASQIRVPKDPLLAKSLLLKRSLDLYHKANDVQEPQMGFGGESWDPVIALKHKYLTAQATSQLEYEVLTELEKFLYRSGNTQRLKSFPTWMSLWILILSYQEHMHLVNFFHDADQSIRQPLYSLAKHMFNALTTIYATIYDTETPLLADWHTSEISDLFGGDAALLGKLLELKTEIFAFYTEKDKLPSDDALFKTLVVEKEWQWM